MKVIIFKCIHCGGDAACTVRGTCDICGKEELGNEFILTLDMILNHIQQLPIKRETNDV